MKFPASLTPWAEHLQIFPEEISLTLGGYVRKISPFISPLNSFAEDSNGEPNGYDGIARRGIYERLLLSELALADDFGDEFIRRAVMGEHLFLNPSRVSPGAKRVSIALFDAGAMQIGAPRIAHLAAFIVLARRAEASDAMFLWGILQSEKQLIISDETEASIKILLESRMAKDVSENDISAWREKLRDVDKMADVWLVGSENIARFGEAKGFSHLYVEESLELEKRELNLKIKSASGIEKQTVLELPPPNICTRLLRNPFEALPKIEFSSATLDGKVTNFFFDKTGSKVFAKIDSDNLLYFNIQNKSNIRKIYPTVYKPENSGKKYLAAGRLRKAIAVVSKIDAKTLRLEYRKTGFGLNSGRYVSQNQQIAFPEDENGLLQIYNVRPQGFHYDEAAIVDAKRNLFLLANLSKDRFEGSEPVGSLILTATDVLAVGQNERGFSYIGCEDGNEHHLLISISDKIERFPLAGLHLKQAFFGRSETGGKICAFETEAGEWKILDEENNERIMPQPKGKVVGVYRSSRFAPNAGFFELMEDRQTIEFCWQYGRRKQILKADEEITKVEISTQAPFLAYTTVSGELVFYSLTHRTAIGRYSK